MVSNFLARTRRLRTRRGVRERREAGRVWKSRLRNPRDELPEDRGKRLMIMARELGKSLRCGGCRWTYARSMRYYAIVALIQDNKAWTPADLAPKSGNDDLAELLR